LPHLDPVSHARHARHSVRFAAIAIVSLAALAMVATGCGSKSKSPAATPTPLAISTAAQLSTSGPAPTAPPAPTAIDPATTPLVPDPDSGQAYTIRVPASWVAANIPAPGGFGRRYSVTQNGAPEAQVTIRCAAGGTVDALMQTDESLVNGIHGNWAVDGVADVTVGGMTGKSVKYTLLFGGKQQETRVLYLQGKICGWVILEQAFGTGQLARYAPLFNAIMATFTPTTAGG
jgi:hypothetical protein